MDDSNYRSDERHEAALALVKLLARGNLEIEQGKFTPAAEVFAEMDKDDLE